MRIDQEDLYRGAALMQVAEHRSFKALNTVTPHRTGHYQVNHDKRMLVKYATVCDEQHDYAFSFSPQNVETVWDDIFTGKQAAFLVLVCADESICVLDEGQIQQLLSFPALRSQTIWVRCPPRGSNRSMRVTSTEGHLDRTVRHKRFPDVLFGEAD